jgi:hypothetical protein
MLTDGEATRMSEPLTVGAALAVLEMVARTYGPDVPLRLVAPGRDPQVAPGVPLDAILLGLEAGHPVVVLRAGREDAR